MPQRLRLAPHLSPDELRARYQDCKDPVERSHWQVLWLVSQGRGSADIAAVSGYTVTWVRKLVRRYREDGPEAMRDGRHDNPGQPRLLEAADESALEQALGEPPEDGGLWSGPKVARWMSAHLGRQVRPVRGWEVLRRLGYTPQRPRRRHAKADPAAQERFQAGAAPSPR